MIYECTAASGGGMVGDLDGKFAVITGAGSGMAKASAGTFVREGAQVLGVDISGGEKETAGELGMHSSRSTPMCPMSPM
jgi:NAD(P)-dependent dehydrogenase (short-subunit alcohol dehydrogenase family)